MKPLPELLVPEINIDAAVVFPEITRGFTALYSKWNHTGRKICAPYLLPASDRYRLFKIVKRAVRAFCIKTK